MGQRLAKFILKVAGWTVVEPPVEEDKCIILGVPHTCIADFLIAYLYYTAVGGKVNIMVKKEFFFWPAGPLLRRMGAIPVDRKKGVNVINQTIEALRGHDKMHLALAPEGTRAPVRKWKSGYHHIARALGIPVYLGYFDWGTKRVGRGERFELSDDAAADLVRIQQHYKKMGIVGRYPEKYVYLEEVEKSI